MNASTLVQKLWNYCNVLRDDGMSYGDYVEQLTYLLFLKMADERAQPPYNQASIVPGAYSWPSLLAKDGDELFDHYRHCLEAMGQHKGTLGLIFGKAQNKFQDPAKLRRLVVDLIDAEIWTALGVDVKGDAYEGLLEKNAQDTKSGAGQYFTPRALIQATARVCAMNLLLHGIGSEKSVPVKVMDALAADPGDRYDVVLANPPFGKKSSTVFVGEDGRAGSGKDIVERDDFWATTSNKQFNFVQHIKTLLKVNGRAAVVLPDNVLFFDKRPASQTPWTEKLWIYDLRTNKHFTLKTNPLKREHLDEFVRLYHPSNRHERKPTWSVDQPEGRWRAFDQAELLARDKASLDIFWLRDESLADSDKLPPPDVIAQEIVDDLEAALEQFRLIAGDLAEPA